MKGGMVVGVVEVESPVWLPVIFSRVMLNQFKTILFCKEHEPIHGTLWLVRFVLVLLLCWG